MWVSRADIMRNTYGITALYTIYFSIKRPAMPLIIMSNKFALSDIKKYAQRYVSVALVSWVDSAEIASLTREVSI